MNFFEEMHARLLAYITEHTGLDAATVQKMLDAQANFWEERPALMDRAHDTDDEGPLHDE